MKRMGFALLGSSALFISGCINKPVPPGDLCDSSVLIMNGKAVHHSEPTFGIDLTDTDQSVIDTLHFTGKYSVVFDEHLIVGGVVLVFMHVIHKGVPDSIELYGEKNGTIGRRTRGYFPYLIRDSLTLRQLVKVDQCYDTVYGYIQANRRKWWIF